MLENTNSGTIYQLQGTIYRLIRSIIRWEVDALIYSLKRSTLMRWDEVASLRWLLAMAIAMEFESQEL